MNQKKALYKFCQSFVEKRLIRIHNSIASIQIALTSETKSSAGDKHETGRAMLQLEREKLGRQLAEAETIKQVLTKVNINSHSAKIALGSLVKTSKANYFLSVSAGEFKDNVHSVFCISVGTPIGQLLLGKSIEDTFSFNGQTVRILEID